MTNLSQTGILLEAFGCAVLTQMRETRTNLIQPGTKVSHLDTKQFGAGMGLLLRYENDNKTAVVQVDSGDEQSWDTDGMVNIVRIRDLMDQRLTEIEKEVTDKMMEVLSGILAPVTDEDGEIVEGPHGPGCTCPWPEDEASASFGVN